MSKLLWCNPVFVFRIEIEHYLLTAKVFQTHSFAVGICGLECRRSGSFFEHVSSFVLNGSAVSGSRSRFMKDQQKTKHNYWMVKQEPETYSWDDFVKDGSTDWSGVRNYQARNNLRA